MFNHHLQNKTIYNDDLERSLYNENNPIDESFYDSFDEKIIEDILGDCDWSTIKKELFEKGVVPVENFIKPKYAEKLRQLTLHTNIRNNCNRRGYGSIDFEYDLRMNGVLYKIIEEIKKNLLPNYVFDRGWTFIYQNECKGVEPHSDPNSDITINFWVTPKECCIISPNKENGFIVWDISNVCLEEYSVPEGTDFSKATYTYVDYDYCKAVLFFSQKIHETNGVLTKPGYENSRINYTFCFQHIDRFKAI